jgi:hypothetical protein
MIKTYRNKIKEKRAIQWDGLSSTYLEIYEAFLDGNLGRVSAFVDEEDGNSLVIATSDGSMTAKVGDYVIQGISGCVYPCREDIFHESYEEVVSE